MNDEDRIKELLRELIKTQTAHIDTARKSYLEGLKDEGFNEFDITLINELMKHILISAINDFAPNIVNNKIAAAFRGCANIIDACIEHRKKNEIK